MPKSAAAAERQRRLRELQRLGFRGGRIVPHRAMIGLPLSWWVLVDLFVYPAIFLGALALLNAPITGLWRRFFQALAAPLGLPGGVSSTAWELGPATVHLPAFAAGAAWPGTPGLLLGWLVTVLLALCGWLLRGAATPFGYLLRAMAVIQLTAQLWFTFASPPFTYTLQGYQEAVLYLGCVVMFLVPFGTAFTYNVFDFRWWQKLGLTGMILAHLVVLLPIKVAVHAYLIHHLTLLALPMLYLLFGILLDVFAFVALYGWGMSWRSRGELDAVDRRPPPPVVPPGTDPIAPATGDPEAGRRAAAAREAAALAATLTVAQRSAPAPAPAPTSAPAAAPAPAAAAAAAPAAAPTPAPPPTPPTAEAGTPTPEAPRLAPPRSGRAVPLVFGKPPATPPRKRSS